MSNSNDASSVLGRVPVLAYHHMRLVCHTVRIGDDPARQNVCLVRPSFILFVISLSNFLLSSLLLLFSSNTKAPAMFLSVACVMLPVVPLPCFRHFHVRCLCRSSFALIDMLLPCSCQIAVLLYMYNQIAAATRKDISTSNSWIHVLSTPGHILSTPGHIFCQLLNTSFSTPVHIFCQLLGT